jgi:putative endopeptidase
MEVFLMRRAVFAAITAALLAACSGTTNTPPPQAQPISTASQAMTTRPLFGEHGFDTSTIDRNVSACDDFYQFAVGKWREQHPLPSTYSRFGRFEEVAERNRMKLREILEDDAKNAASAPRGSAAQKLGDFYNSCMNETAVEAAGVSPIAPDLASIDAIHDRASLEDEIIRLQQRGVGSAFRFGAQNDFANARMMIATLSQGGISLPDRDYYLRDNERFKNIRNKYTEHVTKMLALAGEPQDQAAADAARVVALETRLAKAQMDRVAERDPRNRYHITPVTQLASTDPNFDWSHYFSSMGAANLSSLNVAQPSYFSEVNKMMSDTPLEDWKAYLKWRLLDTAAPTLSSAFVNEDFEFNRVISGQKEIQERWKRCIRATDASLGQLLGQEYVRRNFTPEAKAKMDQLINNLVDALRTDIPTLSWMGPETKQAALVKLNAFARRIGYPDKWTDYTALNVGTTSYAANVTAARQFALRRNISRIGKEDDPNEWGFFTPPTVNASYSPSRNDITFPAGILQPPFYDPNADDAYNYGGIGTVIGHEMTHGFDDEGAKFDAQGNLRNWWTPADLKNFEGRAECIVNEYGEFNVAPGININGKLVTGESIADLGGATIALAAYEKSLQGKKRETIDGFTPEQRFFLGFAQVWAENMAPEEQTRRALTDPHAQGPFRVNGTVQNMPAFAKAFNCSNGAKMVREEAKRCAIW